MFFPAGVIRFLGLMGFRKFSNGVMRILTDQLNSHILVVKKTDIKSSYTVTKTGFSYLRLEICSNNLFKNPMISRTMKNGVIKLAAQPSQIEETHDQIHRGLSQLTQ
jgi:hypothetical protein